MHLPKISFIVCSHGFGHFKRVVQVITELLQCQENVSIVMFCKRKQLELIGNWPDIQTILSDDRVTFETTGMEHAPNWDGNDHDEEYFRWTKSLAEERHLLTSSVVVSDNYVSPLASFPNALLMGSFLWHDVMKGMARYETIASYEEALLRKITPSMMCVGDMMMPALKEMVNPIPMPWFCEREISTYEKKVSGKLLITGGGTASIEDRAVQLIDALVQRNRFQVLVDSRLYARLKSDKKEMHVSLFSFEKRDFDSLDMIVCRPGLGILTEAVKYGVPVLSIGEQSNLEMRYNGNCIQHLEIGTDANEKATADIVMEIERISSTAILSRFRANLLKLKTGGAKSAARHILSSLTRL